MTSETFLRMYFLRIKNYSVLELVPCFNGPHSNVILSLEKEDICSYLFRFD